MSQDEKEIILHSSKSMMKIPRAVYPFPVKIGERIIFPVDEFIAKQVVLEPIPPDACAKFHELCS
jgi:hypothetical protein